MGFKQGLTGHPVNTTNIIHETSSELIRDIVQASIDAKSNRAISCSLPLPPPMAMSSGKYATTGAGGMRDLHPWLYSIAPSGHPGRSIHPRLQCFQAEWARRSPGARERFGRKVRTGPGAVMANGHRRRRQGQCHRDETADGCRLSRRHHRQG